MQNSPKLLEVSAMQLHYCYAIVLMHTNLLVLEKSSAPKLPAFKMGHSAGCNQTASKHSSRLIWCYNKACIHLFFQLFSKIARNNPQILVCKLQKFVLYQSNTRFANFDSKHAREPPQTCLALLRPPAPVNTGAYQELNKKLSGMDVLLVYIHIILIVSFFMKIHLN